jgi:hypothetical protein
MNSVLKVVRQLIKDQAVDSPCTLLSEGPFEGRIWRMGYVHYNALGKRTTFDFKVKELGGFGGPRFVVLYSDFRDQLRVDGLNTRRFSRTGGMKNLCRLLLRAVFLMNLGTWEKIYISLEFDERRVANDQLAITYNRC